ncbi:MAG: hypothetical protein Q8S73_02130 [Deltaproteobacteria bacterium]|nr:hypothetical protein [Myxococcales bacterium]MDP3212875.1 hypothetical protein [Deltaproteobacteria bacterium]
MTPEQRQLAFDLALDRVSLDDFSQRAELDPRQPGFVAQVLRHALENLDAVDVECALLLANIGGLAEDDVPTLCEILLAPWHTRHEDVIGYLQRLRDPRSIDALARAAVVKHAYLHHDDSHALARKCTWALADIGTQEARSHLEMLSCNSDAELAAYAQKRLNAWEEERPRKRGD